ncbi:MAG: SLOG family protein [Eubacteriales bacterium]
MEKRQLEDENAGLWNDEISTVCFTGHRNIKESLRPQLDGVLRQFLYSLYDRGARTFKTGGAIGFDTMAALAVLDLKYSVPDSGVKLFLCLPAPDQTFKYSEYDSIIYKMILDKCDGITYVSDHCTTKSYYARNRLLVEGSDVCVAFCTTQHGGTYYTCRNALLSGVEFINLADFVEL